MQPTTREDIFTNALVKGQHDVALGLLWYLDANDGIHLSLASRELYEWIHVRNRHVVMWWRDQKLYHILDMDDRLLKKIHHATKKGKWRFESPDGTLEGTRRFEQVVQFWRDGLFRRYADGSDMWSFGSRSDDPTRAVELLSFGFPETVTLQMSSTSRLDYPRALALTTWPDSMVEHTSHPCVRCGNQSQNVIYYPISEKVYCSSCMDQDLFLALTFLRQIGVLSRRCFEEANYVPDFFYPMASELDASEFSICIQHPSWREADEDCIWWIGQGRRDPNVNYS